MIGAEHYFVVHDLPSAFLSSLSPPTIDLISQPMPTCTAPWGSDIQSLGTLPYSPSPQLGKLLFVLQILNPASKHLPLPDRMRHSSPVPLDSLNILCFGDFQIFLLTFYHLCNKDGLTVCSP